MDYLAEDDPPNGIIRIHMSKLGECQFGRAAALVVPS